MSKLLFVEKYFCSNNVFYTTDSVWPYGAMVARLTPDQEVGCSNHSWANIFISYYRGVQISGSFIGHMSNF